MNKMVYKELLKAAEIDLKIASEKIDALKQELKEQEVQIVMVPIPGIKGVQNLDELEASLIMLGRKDHYTDTPEIEFDSIIVLTKEDFEHSFEWIQESLPFEEESVQITATAGRAWITRIGYAAGMPILTVLYSERDANVYSDLIMKEGMINNLKVAILERLVIKYMDKYTRYATEIKKLTFLAKKERKDANKLLRLIKNRLLLIDNETRDDLEDVDKKEFKIKHWQFALVAAGWIVAFVLAFFV